MMGLSLGLSLGGRRTGNGSTSLIALTAALDAANVQRLIFIDSAPYLFQDINGTTPVTADGQQVAMQLDAGRMKGLPPDAFIAAQPELRGAGAPALVGSATAATYNTATGAGVVTRVDGTNRSIVQFSGLNPNSLYRIDLTNTGAGPALSVARGPSTPIEGVASGARKTVYAQPGAGTNAISVFCTNNATTCSFTINEFREVPGFPRSQATGTRQPKYRTDGSREWLDWDGVDDGLSTSVVDFTASDEMMFAIALRKLLTTSRVVFELGPNVNSTNGTFICNTGSAGLSNFASGSKGTGGRADAATVLLDVEASAILGARMKISAPFINIRRNGAQEGHNNASQGSGNYSAQVMNFGSRDSGGQAFRGETNCTAIAQTNDQSILALAERVCADQAKVTL